jgi:hypothetical protein
VISCDNQFNAALAALCGTQAVSAGAVAVVGSSDLYGNHITALAAAGIPVVGPAVTGPVETSSPFEFPLAGSTQSIYTAATYLLHSQGCDSVFAMDQTATAFTVSLNEAVKAETQALNIKYAGDAIQGSGDAAPAVNKAVGSGAQCIVGIESGDALLKLLTSLRQINKTITVASNPLSFTAPITQQLGASLAEGLNIVSAFYSDTDTSNPSIAAIHDQMSTYASGTDVNGFVVSAWTSMDFFIKLAQKLPSVTASSVLAAVKAANVSEPTLLGQNFSLATPLAVPGQHFFNAEYQGSQIKNGTLTPLNTFNVANDMIQFYKATS